MSKTKKVAKTTKTINSPVGNSGIPAQLRTVSIIEKLSY